MRKYLRFALITATLFALGVGSAQATIVTRTIFGTVYDVFTLEDSPLRQTPYFPDELLIFNVTYDDDATTMQEGTDGADDIAFTGDDVLWQVEASTYKNGQYSKLSNARFDVGFENIFQHIESSILQQDRLYDLGTQVQSHMQNEESDWANQQFVYNGDHRTFITNSEGGSFGVRFTGPEISGLSGDDSLYVHFHVNAPGSIPQNPLLPTNDDDGFEFSFEVDDPNRTVWIDPLVAIGYDYIVDSGPSIQSVVLPTGIGDDLYDLWTFDVSLNDFVDSGVDLLGGNTYDFGVGGTDRFRILGIEASSGLDPTDATAFVTGLNFTNSGSVNMRQLPITFDTDAVSSGIVPLPATWLLALGGILGIGVFRTRDQSGGTLNRCVLVALRLGVNL